MQTCNLYFVKHFIIMCLYYVNIQYPSFVTMHNYLNSLSSNNLINTSRIFYNSITICFHFYVFVFFSSSLYIFNNIIPKLSLFEKIILCALSIFALGTNYTLRHCLCVRIGCMRIVETLIRFIKYGEKKI